MCVRLNYVKQKCGMKEKKLMSMNNKMIVAIIHSSAVRPRRLGWPLFDCNNTLFDIGYSVLMCK